MLRELWMSLTLALTLIAAMPAFSAETDRTPDEKGTMEGKVLQINPETIVLRDKEGKEVALHLGQPADVDPAIKPGDRVEAYVSPQGITTSVKLLKEGLRR